MSDRFLKVCISKFRSSAEHDSSVSSPEPEHVWKTLSLVNGWIRHADAKAGVTLAFAGVLGTLVFNLSEALSEWNLLTILALVLTCVPLLLTAVLCGLTLTPRTQYKSGEPERENLLFFATIARDYDRQRSEYRKSLVELSADPTSFTEQLADQVHANALVATSKTTWAKRAVLSALAASAGVASFALIVGIIES